MKKQLLFSLILLLASLGQVAADLYLPSLPAIAHSLGSDISWVQMTVSVYMFGFAVSQLIYGPVSDGIGRKPPLIIGISLLLLGSLLCSTAQSITWVIIGRCLQGAGAGSGVALSRAILRDTYTGTDLAKFGSYLAVGGIIIMAAAPLLGGYIQHMFDWRGNFIFLTFYTAITLTVISTKLPETNQHKSKHHLKLSQWLNNVTLLFKHRLFVSMSIMIFMAYAGILAWLTTGPVLLQINAGLSPVEFGWIAVCTGAAYGLGGLSNGKLVKKFGLKKMIFTGLLLMFIGAISMILLGLTINSTHVWTIVIPIALFIGGTGFIFANAYACALSPFGKIAGNAGSILGFMQILGGALASTLLAHLEEQSQMPLAFVIFSATIIALIVFCNVKNHLKG